ncbi:hypothetical protein Pint_23193 [Pistacia integerrima]|uniref:Uncharacterized protein n=1 Tax=Pistacia integerrima TaxID=434235 RepID=A0ACC0YJ10_9ROSI|nr:hypothetical protein Pint_23193 [Pistacia integerrima]
MERWNKNCNGYICDYQDKNYIHHPVSKFDTLVGIAIKYGVEVADIKKINGLSTDLQMFGLNSLQIPLPGKHPPSSSLSNGRENPRGSMEADYDGVVGTVYVKLILNRIWGKMGITKCTFWTILLRTSYDQTSQQQAQLDPFDSFQSLRLKLSPERKVTPAMSSLQGYYGLKPTVQRPISEGFEMMVYENGEARNFEDCHLLKSFPTSNSPLDNNRRSKSYVNLAEPDEMDDYINVADVRKSEPDKRNKKLVRRRQKSEVNFASHTPEMVLKEENSSADGIPAITGKSLAPRPKSVNRAALVAEAAKTGLSPVPFTLGDCLPGDQLSGVRKSSSTSNLQDQTSIWPTSKWDLQALSTVAIAKPILDGLPNPISGRRNKTALD